MYTLLTMMVSLRFVYRLKLIYNYLGDPCYIGFTLGQYTVSEGAGSVSVCVNLTCPANKTNSIRMEVYSDDTVTVPRPLASKPIS